MSQCFVIAMAGRPIDDDCVAIGNRNKRRYNFEGTNTEGFYKTILVRHDLIRAACSSLYVMSHDVASSGVSRNSKLILSHFQEILGQRG